VEANRTRRKQRVSDRTLEQRDSQGRPTTRCTWGAEPHLSWRELLYRYLTHHAHT